jgi:hypothetical protein
MWGSYVVPRCISLFGLDLTGMKETLQESSLKGFGYGKAVALTNTMKLSVSIVSILNILTTPLSLLLIGAYMH